MQADPLQQLEPPANWSGLVLVKVIACGCLALVFAFGAITMPSEKNGLAITGLCLAMSLVFGLGSVAYQAIRALEQRVARLEKMYMKSVPPAVETPHADRPATAAPAA